jgi:hypothetical protein
VAVKTSKAALVDVTEKVATPDALLVPWMVVITGVPAPDVMAKLTVLPETGLFCASFNVTVIVEGVAPSAVTEPGEADTVDATALTGPAVKLTVAVAVITRPLSLVSVAV